MDFPWLNPSIVKSMSERTAALQARRLPAEKKRSFRLRPRCPEGGKPAIRPERNPAQTDPGRIIDCIGDSGDQRFAYSLARTIVGQIGPARVWIAVHNHDINLRRRIGMGERGMRKPVDACNFFRVELHFL